MKNQTLNHAFSQSHPITCCKPPLPDPPAPSSANTNPSQTVLIQSVALIKTLCIFQYISLHLIFILVAFTVQRAAPSASSAHLAVCRPPTGGVSRSAGDLSPHWTGKRRSAGGAGVPPGRGSGPAGVRGPGGRPCSAWRGEESGRERWVDACPLVALYSIGAF